MLIQATARTNYFRLGIVVLATLLSCWVIKEAFVKPFANWENYNEIRNAEINAIIGDGELELEEEY